VEQNLRGKQTRPERAFCKRVCTGKGKKKEKSEGVERGGGKRTSWDRGGKQGYRRGGTAESGRGNGGVMVAAMGQSPISV